MPSKGAAEAAPSGLLTDGLNALAADTCAGVGTRPADIVDAVAVGNTAMHHLFLRLPVQQLAEAPYVPTVRAAVDVKAREMGLQLAPGAYVHLLPNIAGYVGADHVAMLLATGMGDAHATTLAIDIGTNTEMCLRRRGADQPVVRIGAGLRGRAHQVRDAGRAGCHRARADRRGGRVEYKTIGDARRWASAGRGCWMWWPT